MESFHNQLIFEAFNEALNLFRPFGKSGTPLPWKFGKNYIPRVTKEEDVEAILNQAREKVLNWSSLMCGYLAPANEFQEDPSSPANQDSLNQKKEERLSRLITQEVMLLCLCEY